MMKLSCQQVNYWLLLMLVGIQPVHALGITEAWQLALVNDPEFQSAIQASQASKEQESIGLSALLPKVTYDYQKSYNDSRVTSGNRSLERQYGSYVSSLSLHQPLLDYESWSVYQQGTAGAEQAKQLMRDQQQRLLLRLFKAYTAVLYHAELTELVEHQQRVFTEHYQLNQRLYQAGEGTLTDTLETEARLNLASAEKIAAQNNLDLSLQDLELITGTEVKIAELTPLLKKSGLVQSASNSYQDWLSLAIKHNAQLLALNHSIEIAKHEIEKQRAGYFPRATFIASYRNTYSDGESNYRQRYDTGAVGIQISVPIFSGGGTSAAIRRAQAQYQQAINGKDLQYNEIRKQLRKHYNLLNSSRAKISAYQLAEQTQKTLIVATKSSVQGGERINPDVLNAELQLRTVQRELSEARYSAISAWLELHYYAGLVDGKVLQQLASLFERR
ncbi:TolC family outer membrane protein [Rosenbergiella epipactidis]|uniref:TolC family outer membrane protein n=1 Tax=Rosenbergiella epipactidis TaxID=1544694 RepID=UPI001F4F4F8E|nr:TolC family outer membrane protein [Rosenbergiella epipactidis]